jgi:ribA/ribD-fused uncharacterized protein
LLKKFIYFWKSNSPFSQLYYSTFIDEFGNKFYNTEQYMMYYKALLFNDNAIAEQILLTKNPKEIKRLGRCVKIFKESTWETFREQIVYKGNLFKFTQNKKLSVYILNTKKLL